MDFDIAGTPPTQIEVDAEKAQEESRLTNQKRVVVVLSVLIVIGSFMFSDFNVIGIAVYVTILAFTAVYFIDQDASLLAFAIALASTAALLALYKGYFSIAAVPIGMVMGIFGGALFVDKSSQLSNRILALSPTDTSLEELLKLKESSPVIAAYFKRVGEADRVLVQGEEQAIHGYIKQDQQAEKDTGKAQVKSMLYS